MTSNPQALTPVEQHGGHWTKRDDLFEIDGSCGGKVRSCLALASPDGITGLVTAGARHSPQVNIVATIARRLNLPCRVHVPAAAHETPELEAAREAGAEVFGHRPGYNNVIIARARQDALDTGYLEVPFGMECQAAVDQTAAQTRNLPVGEFKRLVIPLGSGMSLAGILAGTVGATWPVLGVAVGAPADKRLDRWSPGWRDRVSVTRSSLPYDKYPEVQHLGGLRLDPVYESKCIPFLESGDLLWIVGRRATAAKKLAS